ncbi:hypothetical protein R2B67_35765 [Streptomyces cyaneofuscatus]|uniref:hypothetical protein n=1 Tax=Streptomyces cyaneofuscatus TaxID=66883 RepID=UPI002952A249|nr:hypothetical protein [Streptomyces cyaneofuscatus]WOP13574.1 hypothetical protein R2B67_35765 [Streptomyces cyaneofuscatus]
MRATRTVERIDLFESYLARHPRLRLRISCPSQEFSELEMAQGVGRWLSCVRGMWESLDVGTQSDLALLMFQAPAVPHCVEQYVLGLIPPGATGLDDRPQRHILVGLNDASDRHLSEKLLDRPDLLRRIRALVMRARERGHAVEPLSCYQASARMDELAERLGLECRETPTRTLGAGSKAGSRQIFRAAGLPHAAGTYAPAFGLPELARQTAGLVRSHGPGKWLLKINEGYGSGHGLAVVTVPAATREAALSALRALQPLTRSITRAQFLSGLSAHGAIIEQYLETPAAGKNAPRAPCCSSVRMSAAQPASSSWAPTTRSSAKTCSTSGVASRHQPPTGTPSSRCPSLPPSHSAGPAYAGMSASTSSPARATTAGGTSRPSN